LSAKEDTIMFLHLWLQDKIAACITLEQGKTFEDAKGDVMRGLRKSALVLCQTFILSPLVLIDYCNTVLAGAPTTVVDKLQRVLNAEARVVTGIWKFDRGLGQLLHDELHWLDVPDRVFFKLAVTVHRCLNGRAPPYLSDYCVPAAGVDTRQHLRSANRQLLAVPRYRLNTYGRQAFSVAGPTVWNSLPDFIWDPTISADFFRRLLKTYLFAWY